MKSKILFLHSEDDHLVPIHVLQQVRPERSFNVIAVIDSSLVALGRVNFPLTVLPQMYEVAARAQDAERVKLVTFEASLGYLHNGLYRDARLPDIIK